MKKLTQNIKRMTALCMAVCLMGSCGKKSKEDADPYGTLETLPPVSTVVTTEPAHEIVTPEELKTLEEKLNSMLPGYGGTWSVYVQELSSGNELLINDCTFYAASEIKLFTMAAAYQKVADGKIKESAITDDMEYMITESDNYCFNDMLSIIGKDYTNKWCYANGYKGTSENHGLYPATNYTEDLRCKEGDSFTCAKDMGRLLASIYRGECVSEEYSQKMLDFLLEQYFRSKIPAGVPSVTRVANKTGETDDENHDAAIVFSEGGDYVLTVMTQYKQNAWSLDENIAEVSEIVFDFFNGIPYPDEAPATEPEW